MKISQMSVSVRSILDDCLHLPFSVYLLLVYVRATQMHTVLSVRFLYFVIMNH